MLASSFLLDEKFEIFTLSRNKGAVTCFTIRVRIPPALTVVSCLWLSGCSLSFPEGGLLAHGWLVPKRYALCNTENAFSTTFCLQFGK